MYQLLNYKMDSVLTEMKSFLESETTWNFLSLSWSAVYGEYRE